MSQGPPDTDARARMLMARPWVRRAALAAGLLLVMGAVAAVWARREVVAQALQSVADPAPAPAALLAAAVAANLVLSGLMFSVLMSRHGRVGVLEMQGLIAATALLNYMPLRAGMFGRIAYHQAINRIAPWASAATIVQALVLSAAAGGFLAAALMLAARGASLRLMVAAPLPILALAALWRPARIWSLAGLLRYLDVVAWAVRYHTAFALLGSPIDDRAALAMACISIVASTVPLAGNGLGLREWAIGLAAPLLTAYHLELGLTAELLNRAAEIAVVAVAGGVSLAALAVKVRTGERVA